MVRIRPSRNRYWRLVSAIVALAAVARTSAEPAISTVEGTVEHGSELTIRGSALGTHANYGDGQTWQGATFLNFRFIDFEDGQIIAHGFFEQSGDARHTFLPQELGIVTAAAPVNSTRYLRRAWFTTRLGGLSARISGAGQQLYSTFKFKADQNVQAGKIWRLYGTAPQRSVYLAAGCARVSNPRIRGGTECTSPSCAGARNSWGEGPTVIDGNWHRIEVWVDASRNTFSVAVDGQAALSKHNWLSADFGMNGHTIDFPNMINSPSSTEPECPAIGSYSYDDIFIDFTRTRVELADAPTWTAVRSKEIQLPTSWRENSISVRVNVGSFTAGRTAFLYVVDADGSVNATGYPVTVVASSRARSIEGSP
jgi:hypothetical protein